MEVNFIAFILRGALGKEWAVQALRLDASSFESLVDPQLPVLLRSARSFPEFVP
jgi:hypothetical protein